MKKKATKKKVAAKTASVPLGRTTNRLKAEEKVAGFRADSQAARMFNLLSDGKPRTVKEIHRVISETTEDHVGNGLLYALRKRGCETGKFHIVMTADHKLQLRKSPKPEKAVKKTKAARPIQAKTVTVKVMSEAHHE